MTAYFFCPQWTPEDPDHGACRGGFAIPGTCIRCDARLEQVLVPTPEHEAWVERTSLTPFMRGFIEGYWKAKGWGKP